ncbi:DNA ligase 1-like isoform X2 [Papaver somniferum]|uniref:DNA ligase 1-like isoform X2 n=1 Tax=Papaver somniferum TaxID=3469 RepID=UPI000E6F6A2B|nr:DNA ligase 1-like isoform X2 [Papaver somniferum]
MDEEVILHKSEKKKHKRSKEKEALSSSEVPTEKKKLNRKKEVEMVNTSEVPSEKKKNKKSKEKEILSTSEVPTEKKKHRKSKEKEALSSSELPIDVGGEKKVKRSRDKDGFPDNGREESGKRKDKKGKEKVTECSDVECATDQAASKGKDHIDVGGEQNNENAKNGKGKNKKRENANGGDSGESCIEKSGAKAESGSCSSKKRNREEEVLDVAIGEEKKKKKKKTKLDANIENTKANVGDVETENNFGRMNEHLRTSCAKRVKFASHAEVFPSSDDQDDREENLGNRLVQGKRFTQKEDQIIKDAVHKYIEAHELDKEGLDMILNCRKHSKIITCWKEIGAALPYRPYKAVYERGVILFERSESRNWTEDEKAVVLKLEKLGPDPWEKSTSCEGYMASDISRGS